MAHHTTWIASKYPKIPRALLAPLINTTLPFHITSPTIRSTFLGYNHITPPTKIMLAHFSNSGDHPIHHSTCNPPHDLSLNTSSNTQADGDIDAPPLPDTSAPILTSVMKPRQLSQLLYSLSLAAARQGYVSTKGIRLILRDVARLVRS